MDSIQNNCDYTAYSCDSYEDFKKGICIKCPKNGCNRMGYWASPSKSTGSLYLDTKSLRMKPSYCQNSYQVSLISGDNADNFIRGEFYLTIKTTKVLYENVLWDYGESVHKSGSTVSKLVPIGEGLRDDEEILSVSVSYTRISFLIGGWYYDTNWAFKYLEIFSGENQTTKRFCAVGLFVKSGNSLMFEGC